jgi:hypothetical protein
MGGIIQQGIKMRIVSPCIDQIHLIRVHSNLCMSFKIDITCHIHTKQAATFLLCTSCILESKRI